MKSKKIPALRKFELLALRPEVQKLGLRQVFSPNKVQSQVHQNSCPALSELDTSKK